MLIFALIVLMLVLGGVKLAKKGEFHRDYAAPAQTGTVNGIFTLLIFLSHASSYFTPAGTLGEPYLTLHTYLGQFVVVPFLFYSGFGITESFAKKGRDYYRGFAKNRLLRTWVHFAAAVVLYILLNAVLGISYGTKQTLLAFTGWTTIGNSNWYMLATFALYLFILAAFAIPRLPRAVSVALTLVLTLLFIRFEKFMGLPRHYYDTMLCFPAGMIFSLVKPWFDKAVMCHDTVWALALTAVFAGFYYCGATRLYAEWRYTAWLLCGMLLILLITMKVKIAGDILDWFGHHVFGIYILQRLPMIFLAHYGRAANWCSFVLISFVSAVALAVLFDFFTEKLDGWLFKKPARTSAPTTPRP